MRGKIDFGHNEIIDLRKIRTTDYHLSHQDPKSIQRFNKYIDKKHEWWLGSAELLYRANLLSYKTQFVTFCCKNHIQVVYDSTEQQTYKVSLENQPTKQE